MFRATSLRNDCFSKQLGIKKLSIETSSNTKACVHTSSEVHNGHDARSGTTVLFQGEGIIYRATPQNVSNCDQRDSAIPLPLTAALSFRGRVVNGLTNFDMQSISTPHSLRYPYFLPPVMIIFQIPVSRKLLRSVLA